VVRFYFVGDEDLLEIIGNSKNVPRLQKHFKKMFAGIHQILLDEEQTQVLGIASKEGEEVSVCCFLPFSLCHKKLTLRRLTDMIVHCVICIQLT